MSNLVITLIIGFIFGFMFRGFAKKATPTIKNSPAGKDFMSGLNTIVNDNRKD